MAAGYLAPFTETRTRKGVLRAYRRADPTVPLRMTAESVAKEKDIFTRRGPGGVVDDSLERFFADEIEGPFLKIRNKLLIAAKGTQKASRITLSLDERNTVALYVAVQHLRTPTERDAGNWLSDLAGRFAVCVDSGEYPASLERRKLYEILPDADAARHGQLRVIDESGEDYLYPLVYFKLVELSPSLNRLVRGPRLRRAKLSRLANRVAGIRSARP